MACVPAGMANATKTIKVATLWCFAKTENFQDCVLMAANLGDDADTTAAQAGQIAGTSRGMADALAVPVMGVR